MNSDCFDFEALGEDNPPPPPPPVQPTAAPAQVSTIMIEDNCDEEFNGQASYELSPPSAMAHGLNEGEQLSRDLMSSPPCISMHTATDHGVEKDEPPQELPSSLTWDGFKFTTKERKRKPNKGNALVARHLSCKPFN